MIYSVRRYREVGENSTQKAIGFRNQEIIDFQGSRFSEICRLEPDYREFYTSIEAVGAVSIDYFCSMSSRKE